MNKLSVIIITKDEEHNIRRCLESVKFADEIIVVDSGSEDRTLAIAREYTDKIFYHTWEGYGKQKNYALSLATGDWVLSVDADEELPIKLQIEISHVVQQENHVVAYELLFKNHLCGKQVDGWHKDYHVRLFRRGFAIFSYDNVHERIITWKEIGDGEERKQMRHEKLKSPILHYQDDSIEELIYKINSYSSLSAKKMFDKRKNSSFLSAITHTAWQFFRSYIIQGRIINGSHGLIMSLSQAEGTFYKYAKLYFMNKEEKQ
jgi:glycosyltransferase involved in cell wall biosynthesis